MNVRVQLRGSGWMGVVGLMVLNWATPSYADDAIAWVNSLIPTGVMATEEKQCAGLDERWQLLREQINKKHEVCLTEQAEAAKNYRIRYGRTVPKMTEDGDRCTYEVCEALHSVMAGRKARELREIQTRQTKACRDSVQKHQQYIQQNQAWVEKERNNVRSQLKELQESPPEDPSALEQFAKEGFKQAGKWSGALGCGLYPGAEAAKLAGGLGCAELGEQAGIYSGSTVEEALRLNRQIRKYCQNPDHEAACVKTFTAERVEKERQEREKRDEDRRMRQK
ncbi:MAG: hypothetical protein ABL983_01545 [Nitrospira sp.]